MGGGCEGWGVREVDRRPEGGDSGGLRTIKGKAESKGRIQPEAGTCLASLLRTQGEWAQPSPRSGGCPGSRAWDGGGQGGGRIDGLQDWGPLET